MHPVEAFNSVLDGIAERNDGLPNAAARWKRWWQTQKQTQKRLEFETWAEDEHNVVKAVREWSERKYPGFPHLPDWLLFQLGSELPFTAWSQGRNLQQEFFERNKNGVYGVGVPDAAPVSENHIWRLLVWLIPKKSSDAISEERVNLNWVDVEARLAVGQTISGLENSLRALSDDWLGWWFLTSGWRQPRWEKWLAGAAFLVAMSLVSLSATLFPDESFLNGRDETLVVLGAQVFIVAAVVLAFAMFAAWRRHRVAVTKETAEWRDLLEQSCLVLAVSNEKWRQPPDRLQIKGSSYSATLALSLLLALDDTKPAGSAFWRSILARLREQAADRLFSMALLADGKSNSVSHLKKKSEAILAFNWAFPMRPIRFFAIPEQGCDCLAAFCPEVIGDRLQPAISDTVVHAGASALTASPSAKPEVQKYGALRDVLFAAPSWPQRVIGGLLLIAPVVLLMFLALRAPFDLYRMLNPSSFSDLSIQISGSAGQTQLTVTIVSADADQFGAVITSNHWQSLLPLPFSKPGSLNQKASVSCDLKVSNPNEVPAGWVEIIRRRRLLWLEWWLEEEIIPARKRFEQPSTSK